LKNKILIIGSSGYIGSFLKEKFSESNLYDVFYVDQNAVDPIESNFIKCRYQELQLKFLKQFEVVLFFAGVSSVSKANLNNSFTIKENTIDMFYFSELCFKANARLIYASSGSVYADNSDNFIYPASEITLNSYDASKLSFDLISKYANPNSIGLRMGTVSGYSLNLREELIFNQMCITSIRDKKILVSNCNNFRSLLFLDDLFIIIKKLLISKNVGGQIPCSSYTGSIGQIASSISNYFNSKIEVIDGSSTYSFALKKSNYDNQLSSSIEYQCKNFNEKWN